MGRGCRRGRSSFTRRTGRRIEGVLSRWRGGGEFTNWGYSGPRRRRGCYALGGHQEPLAIIGANGAGKTTLLKAVAGLDSSSTGEVSLGEQLWQDESSAVPPERRQVGWLPQLLTEAHLSG